MTTAKEQDILRVMTGTMTTILAGACIWMGSTLVSVQQDTAVMKAEMAGMNSLLEAVTQSRYTREQAAADWRFQESINSSLLSNIDRLDERYSEWTGRLSNRLAEVEELLRVNNIKSQ
jgi:hypothetical protein